MEDTGDAWDTVSCKRMPSQIDVVGEVLDDGDMGKDSTEEAGTTRDTAYIVILCEFDMTTKKSLITNGVHCGGQCACDK